MAQFAKVIVPVPVGDTFTYAVPAPMTGQVAPGMRVVVPFGLNRLYTGIVESVCDECPKDIDVKPIVAVIGSRPVVRPDQLRFWAWVAEYYLCTIGDVMRAALPAGLKIESETLLEINPDMEADEAVSVLSERELIAWQQLEHSGKMSVKKLGREIGSKHIASLANRLIEKGAVIISEKLSERFRPLRRYFVRMAFDRSDAEARIRAFEEVKRAPRQQQALVALMQLSGFMQITQPVKEVTRTELQEVADVTLPVLHELERKKIIEIYWREQSRFENTNTQLSPLPELSAAQIEAFRAIGRNFTEKRVTLLHGVTGSGKTEIYMHLIRQALDNNRQALLLVPEIALTTQLTGRLQRVFGQDVLVYHSRFTDNQRAEVWNTLLKSPRPRVVIGARSSVFLPFAQLGLVIVDEEHESSYKQFDPAPRYNARDAAIMVAAAHGAKVLLASATPSIETYYKAESGKYGLVTLTERYGRVELPEIEVVDILQQRKRMAMDGPFARSVMDAAGKGIQEGRQAIFFQNRRGFAPVVRCRHCAFTPKCINCDVSLTLHKRHNRMECHYCGATYPLPEICPECGEPGLEEVGYGTERIEERIAERLPQARVLRMDLDSTRNKDDYATIIDSFSNHKADILVGTQMVAKGLDFEKVDLVAILSADSLIHYPDFRASERAFNMIEQVGGRAGRRSGRGRVIIQSSEPDHPIIEFARKHDYAGYYASELAERRNFFYPPFARVIYIYIKHRDERAADDIAEKYMAELRRVLGNRAMGPHSPLVSRVQNLHIRRIMLKIEPEASPSRVKDILRQVYLYMHAQKQMAGAIVYYDVDPV